MANALADSSQRDLEYAYERASSPDVSSLLRIMAREGEHCFSPHSSFLNFLLFGEAEFVMDALVNCLNLLFNSLPNPRSTHITICT